MSESSPEIAPDPEPAAPASAPARMSMPTMGSPSTSTIIAGLAGAMIVYKDVKAGVSPFYNLLFTGILIVILAGIGQFVPELANVLAFLFLLTALLNPVKKGK